MEDFSNKKKSWNHSSGEKKQIRFRPKKPVEPLQGQEILKGILSEEDIISSEGENELGQIPFEDFGKHSWDEPVRLESIPPLSVETPTSSEEVHPNLEDHGRQDDEGQIEEPEQIKFQSEVSVEDIPQLSPEFSQHPEEIPADSQASLEIIENSGGEDPASSVFRLGTKRAFVVLKDIFGDVDSEGESVHERPLSSKKKLIALFCALFFGIFGGHRFYLGQYKRAPLYLLVLFFRWMSSEFLPDEGLNYLLLIIMVFWVIADILAIIFSRKILDGQGHVVLDWI